jgi:chromosome segregation ATPase
MLLEKLSSSQRLSDLQQQVDQL